MFRKPLIVTLVALITFGSVFVSSEEAQANSVTQAANQAVQQAHRFARLKSEQAGRLQSQLASRQASFNAVVASGDAMRIKHAKAHFIVWLRSLRASLMEAKYAHDDLVRRLVYYRRVSGNNSVAGTINQVAAASARFQATANQISVRIAQVAAA